MLDTNIKDRTIYEMTKVIGIVVMLLVRTFRIHIKDKYYIAIMDWQVRSGCAPSSSLFLFRVGIVSSFVVIPHLL